MQFRFQVDRIFSEPMARQIDGMPAVVHENSSAGKSGLPSPVRVIWIDRRAIFNPQSFNLDRTQFSNRSETKLFCRPGNDRRVFPIMDRNHGVPRFAGERSHLFELTEIKEERLFTQNIPAVRQRLSHRPTVQCRGSANIYEINRETVYEFLDRFESRHIGNQFLSHPSPFFRSLDDCDDLHFPRPLIAGPMPVRGHSAEADNRSAQHGLLAFELLEHAVDNRERGLRLFRGKNERRMNADARRVTHHDEPLGEATLEEFDATLFRQQRFRFPV